MQSLTTRARVGAAEMIEISFHEVDAVRWSDFEQLFESKGGPKSCWCMVWRKGAITPKGPDRKIAMHNYVCSSTPIGLLGYDKADPVAWCSIAPRNTHRDLGGLAESGEPGEQVWSLTCMFLTRKYRGMGLTPQIIIAALKHAQSKGATCVEAYPVELDSPSYRFMGFISMFLSIGFHKVGLAGTRRHIMRKILAR